MPQMVPAHREVIYASGVAELDCAVGLLVPTLWTAYRAARDC